MKDRKKILWLVSWYPNQFDAFEGDFIQRHAQAAALQNDIHVIFIKEGNTPEPLEEWKVNGGLTEQIVYFERPVSFLNKGTKQWRWFHYYKKAIKQYIHKQGLPDLVHVHVPWKAGLLALWIKKKYKVPYLVTEHWGIYNDIVEDNFFKRPFIVQFLLRHIFNKSRDLVSVSAYIANSINKIISKKSYSIIPNAVDTGLFFYKYSTVDVFRFIHVSNMVALKNVEGIIDAFAELLKKEEVPKSQLILVGNKDESYIQYAAAKGLLNREIIFKGEIAYKEVAKEMQASHCLILNSFIENSPCVIGEALCCGLPVIATAVGGIPELVDSSNGILIPPNDEIALMKAMEDIKRNYLQYHTKSIAQKGFEKFSYPILAQQFNAVYANSIKNSF